MLIVLVTGCVCCVCVCVLHQFYNVLAPTCPNQQSDIDWAQYTNRWDRRSSVGSFLASVPFNPCLENYMVPYLNQPSVQAVLGVRPTKWAMVPFLAFLFSCVRARVRVRVA